MRTLGQPAHKTIGLGKNEKKALKHAAKARASSRICGRRHFSRRIFLARSGGEENPRRPSGVDNKKKTTLQSSNKNQPRYKKPKKNSKKIKKRSRLWSSGLEKSLTTLPACLEGSSFMKARLVNNDKKLRINYSGKFSQYPSYNFYAIHR